MPVIGNLQALRSEQDIEEHSNWITLIKYGPDLAGGPGRTLWAYDFLYRVDGADLAGVRAQPRLTFGPLAGGPVLASVSDGPVVTCDDSGLLRFEGVASCSNHDLSPSHIYHRAVVVAVNLEPILAAMAMHPFGTFAPTSSGGTPVITAMSDTYTTSRVPPFDWTVRWVPCDANHQPVGQWEGIAYVVGTGTFTGIVPVGGIQLNNPPSNPAIANANFTGTVGDWSYGLWQVTIH